MIRANLLEKPLSLEMNPIPKISKKRLSVSSYHDNCGYNDLKNRSMLMLRSKQPIKIIADLDTTISNQCDNTVPLKRKYTKREME